MSGVLSCARPAIGTTKIWSFMPSRGSCALAVKATLSRAASRTKPSGTPCALAYEVEQKSMAPNLRPLGSWSIAGVQSSAAEERGEEYASSSPPVSHVAWHAPRLRLAMREVEAREDAAVGEEGCLRSAVLDTAVSGDHARGGRRGAFASRDRHEHKLRQHRIRQAMHEDHVVRSDGASIPRHHAAAVLRGEEGEARAGHTIVVRRCSDRVEAAPLRRAPHVANNTVSSALERTFELAPLQREPGADLQRISRAYEGLLAVLGDDEAPVGAEARRREDFGRNHDLREASFRHHYEVVAAVTRGLVEHASLLNPGVHEGTVVLARGEAGGPLVAAYLGERQHGTRDPDDVAGNQEWTAARACRAIATAAAAPLSRGRWHSSQRTGTWTSARRSCYHVRCCRLATSRVSWSSTPVIAYFSTAEALRWRPWPDSIAGDAAGMQPHDEETAKRSDAAQLEAHRAAAGGAAVDGYASWLSVGGAQKRADPLLVREASQHTGTCIWAASWLHRRWALARAELFPVGAHILEMGAGCGLLGLSVAAAHGVHATLSDFRGHFVGGGGDDTVLHNLAYNAWRNEQLIRANGGAVTTIELDWQRPNEPVRWQVVESATARARRGGDGGEWRGGRRSPALDSRRRGALERASVDVVLATEVLYTEEACGSLWAASRCGSPGRQGRSRRAAHAISSTTRTGRACSASKRRAGSTALRSSSCPP